MGVWILQFDIFLLPFLAKKRCFLSFEKEKSNFTIFGPPGRIFMAIFGKIH